MEYSPFAKLLNNSYLVCANVIPDKSENISSVADHCDNYISGLRDGWAQALETLAHIVGDLP